MPVCSFFDGGGGYIYGLSLHFGTVGAILKISKMKDLVQKDFTNQVRNTKKGSQNKQSINSFVLF